MVLITSPVEPPEIAEIEAQLPSGPIGKISRAVFDAQKSLKTKRFHQSCFARLLHFERNFLSLQLKASRFFFTKPKIIPKTLVTYNISFGITKCCVEIIRAKFFIMRNRCI